MYDKCKLCGRRVTMNTSNGFMQLPDGLYHYKCVCKYGYQKFCGNYDKKYDKNNDKKLIKSDK